MDAFNRSTPRRSFLDRHADKFAVLILAIIILALTLILAACHPANRVGNKSVYDAGGTTLENGSANVINQTDTLGGTTNVQSAGAVHQVFIEADGTVRAIGGGTANKGIAIRLPDGTSVMVASQDDANVEIDEMYSASGTLLAKGVRFSTNVSNPTLAFAKVLAEWAPQYVAALEQARLGNKDQYDALVKTLEATAPVALAVLQAAFGVPPI